MSTAQETREVVACGHQVGGHALVGGKPQAFTDTGGRFYKTLQSGARAGRELAFYQQVAKASGSSSAPAPSAAEDPDRIRDFEGLPQEDLLALAPFLPPFHGTHEVEGSNCLVLGDLCAGLKRPCVIDVKLGFTTAYPWQEESKFVRNRGKDLETSQVTLGYRICGLQVWKRGADASSDGEVFKGDRQYGRDLLPATMAAAFELFANNGALTPRDVYGPALVQLRRLEAALSRQRSLQFFAASVLLAYDGAATSADAADVRLQLVDFAHAYPAKGEADANVLGGLRSVIGLLEALLLPGPHDGAAAAAAAAALAATPGAAEAAASKWAPPAAAV